LLCNLTHSFALENKLEMDLIKKISENRICLLFG